MSQRVEGHRLGGTSDAAIAKYLRVKFDANQKFTVAGDEAFLGTMDDIALAADAQVNCFLENAPGSKIYIANGAIAAGASTSTTTGGKIKTGTTGTVNTGIARTAATADGDLIEVVPVKFA